MAGNSLLKYIINVTNIPWTVSRRELALYFSKFGYVYDASVAFDKETGLHQNHGHVTFLKKQDVNLVLNSKHSLEGKDLILSRKNFNNNDSALN